MKDAAYIVWGPELSPFLLKLEALLVACEAPMRRLPRDGRRLENVRVAAAVERAKRRRTARRPPAGSDLDEYPLVPFLLTPAGDVLYDSSALAEWLDVRHPRAAGPLVPAAPPALGFVAHLIDEAFDEFGLYMVHHNRWKLAAHDNGDPGMRLAREYARHIPPGSARIFASWFARRQVRRLPYLFSVAPAGYHAEGVPPALTAPSREGFPPTHALLETAWERYLAAMEHALASRPFLLGDVFTVADASAYGQLSMNLTDTFAAHRLRELAPRTFQWLEAIRRGEHAGSYGPIALGEHLTPLLEIIAETFVPLMRANAAAYERHLAAGATLFNEKAFDAGVSLYDGEMLGHPFRSVVKTFQVRVWREVVEHWGALPADARAQVAAISGNVAPDEAFARD